VSLAASSSTGVARYGKANEHNALVPRDHWLEYWEKKAIIDFHAKNPLEGYRRLTFMMLDQGRRRRQPGVDLPRAVRGRLAGSLESQAIQQGDRLRPAAGAARALAHRHRVPERGWDLLLPVLDSRRSQPRHRPLGHPRVHDRAGRRDHPPARPRASPDGATADHLRQRPRSSSRRTSRSSSVWLA